MATLGCKTVVDVHDGPADSGDGDRDDGGGLDPVICGGKVCDEGPSPICEDERTLLIWDGTSGPCSDGQCSYVMVRRPCADRCARGSCIFEEDETKEGSDTLLDPDTGSLIDSDTGTMETMDGGDAGSGDAGTDEPLFR